MRRPSRVRSIESKRRIAGCKRDTTSAVAHVLCSMTGRKVRGETGRDRRHDPATRGRCRAGGRGSSMFVTGQRRVLSPCHVGANQARLLERRSRLLFTLMPDAPRCLALIYAVCYFDFCSDVAFYARKKVYTKVSVMFVAALCHASSVMNPLCFTHRPADISRASCPSPSAVFAARPSPAQNII